METELRAITVLETFSDFEKFSSLMVSTAAAAAAAAASTAVDGGHSAGTIEAATATTAGNVYQGNNCSHGSMDVTATANEDGDLTDQQLAD